MSTNTPLSVPESRHQRCPNTADGKHIFMDCGNGDFSCMECGYTTNRP